MGQSTTNSREIRATPESVYNAFTDPAALVTWQAPGDMKATVHHFDLSVDGGYKMTLRYPDNDGGSDGKTTDNEDTFTARFVELVPYKKIVEAIRFDSSDVRFAGEMIMEVTFRPIADGTKVTIEFRNIPIGIRPEDNEAGTLSSLEKLAGLVEVQE